MLKKQISFLTYSVNTVSKPEGIASCVRSENSCHGHAETWLPKFIFYFLNFHLPSFARCNIFFSDFGEILVHDLRCEKHITKI